ncbi:hypothetical protein M422DRAFT_264596 [Sphaerobolus stellatus SS14]|uniref:Uncharacterized protein n=1 Tax=Sphaerobolus stellatus (strain SS14) TaxID=990650 RepID=A0A0C9UFE9_SPHS4|nr:hypothetical protein M422DRAFT_264596 [Sphaerobolus stellatus SS14]
MVGLLLPDVWRFDENGEGVDCIDEGRQAIHEVLVKQFQKANKLLRAHGTSVQSEWCMMWPDSGKNLDLVVANPKGAVLRRQTEQEDEMSVAVDKHRDNSEKRQATPKIITGLQLLRAWKEDVEKCDGQLFELLAAIMDTDLKEQNALVEVFKHMAITMQVPSLPILEEPLQQGSHGKGTIVA